ncbi:MAG TPA: HDOD domain-containing protein [Polyangiales bacterium]|jgi:HD-like signal output (HDOD) protein|nr:HDOD domain-containing protein [Polyangiales bacterium]
MGRNPSVATTPGKGIPVRQGGVTKLSPEYGRGSHEIEAHSFELAQPRELQQMLLTIFRSPNYRPPVLPSVAIELSDLSRKTTVSYDEVVNVLQNDPLIVAGVLKVAQSTIYGGRAPVQSLKEAIQRLGINTLRDIVWQVVAGMRLFRVKGYTEIMERLQAHSVFTACMSRVVAARAGIAAEHAFLCGLLHDVGISGTLIALVEGEKKVPDSGALLVAIDAMHAQAGGMIAKLWGLSPAIAGVIEHHHPSSSEFARSSALNAVLCVAERFADECGFSVVDPVAIEPFDRHVPDGFEQSLARLKLTAKQAELRERAQEVAEAMRT